MKLLIQILSVAVIIFFVILLQNKYFSKIEEVEVIKVDTVWITKTDTIIKEKLVPYKVEIPGDVIYIPLDNDSLRQLYSDLYLIHNTRKSFLMNEKLDSIGTFSINTEVFRNGIEKQTFTYEYKIPQITIDKTVYKEYSYLYGGIIAGKNILAPSLLYTNKKFNVSLQYDIINQTPLIGVGYKLFKY